MSDSATARRTCFVCATCGTQYAETDGPPAACVICSDDRQHVGWAGQEWTTHAQLVETHHNRIEVDGDLLGIGIAERFGIPQRALLLTTDIGNVLWDCISIVTPEAVAAITRRGGIDRIAISHPHFYASMIEWSDAFGGVPIHLHEADAGWIQRTSPHVSTWSGDRLDLSPTVRLVHLPGHFPGSSALHWTAGPRGRRMLLSGDSLHVAGDRRRVTVMHSVPNFIPVDADVIRDLRARLGDLDFDDVYGFTWGLNIIGGGRAAVDESLERYLAAIGAHAHAHA